jgi:tripartite-type tricarboxylate transporter receptor subunit TctC
MTLPTPSLSRRALVLATGLACAWNAGWVQAADAPWPHQAIKLVVGFPAGSSPDLTARALAEPLGKALGQTVVVDNKVGAGGNIAADFVAKSTDGHTLGLMINGNMTIARILNPKVTYDPLKDLAPVSLIGTAPLLLAAPAGSAGGSPAQWLAQARQDGNQLSYGSPGVGTVAHLGMEWLKAQAGIDPVHVPYPGNPQIMNAMMGGQIQLALLPPAMALTQVRAGKLRAIGTTSAGRSTLAPDVPSLSEIGIRNYQLEIWNAVAAPSSMPPAVLNKLSATVSDIVRSPEMRARLFQQGWQVVGSSPEGLRNRIQSDTQALGDIIVRQKIQVN